MIEIITWKGGILEEILKNYIDVIDFEYGEYLIYLRKSRADIEAEEKGEGETLARHLKILLELARKMKIKIGKIYHEIVSGESIADRPEVQKMLNEVKIGSWKGVLVVEVERLARGNTKDQGFVAEAFSISSTKIITPMKIYDPNNEFDEEYFEFGLFMSRREYKVINRRLQRGRITSVKEGKYVGNIAPFGWDRVKIEKDKGYTLKPNEESKIVQMAFDLYAYNDISIKKLGLELDSMGLKPRHKEKWTVSTLKDMLKNPVHIGMIRWNSRKTVKAYKGDKIIKTRPRNNDCIIIKGLQPAIIKTDVWNIVQQKLSTHKVPVQHNNIIYNPLAGLVRCSKCGAIMQRRPYKAKGWDDTLICPNTECDNISSKLYIVENKIIQSLKSWLENYKIDFNSYIDKIGCDNIKILEDSIKESKKAIEIKSKKRTNIYEFLEDGTYTKEMFNDRMQVITKEIDAIKKNLKTQESKLEEEKKKEEEKKNLIPEVENVLALYDKLETAEEKNMLLKTVVKQVNYLKTEKAIKKNSNPENFTLDIFPKINKVS